MGRAGIEPATHGFSIQVPPAVNASDAATYKKPKASLSPHLSHDPRLLQLISSWPELPAVIQNAIVAMAASVQKSSLSPS